MRPCPSCGRKIQDAAPRCHYCHAPVPHPSRSAPSRAESSARLAQPPPRFRVGAAALIGAVVALVVGLLIVFMR